jgi:hypothetical protein
LSAVNSKFERRRSRMRKVTVMAILLTAELLLDALSSLAWCIFVLL